jgi:(p)ppGpp synthase/HD superfamily hydrolase
MSPLVVLADAFAAKAHAGQLRKYTGDPYIVHPRAVANLIKLTDHTDEMLAAALLHDVLEDTPTTVADLLKVFPVSVVEMVIDLTDQIPASYGNRAARKAAEAQRLSQTGAAVQSIKVADMIDNTMSIVQHDPAFAKVYLKEKAALLDVLTDANPFLRVAATAQISLDSLSKEVL